MTVILLNPYGPVVLFAAALVLLMLCRRGEAFALLSGLFCVLGLLWGLLLSWTMEGLTLPLLLLTGIALLMKNKNGRDGL